MRRILFVLDAGYLPDTITGINVSVHALCKRLAAMDVEPIVVCPPDTAPASAPPSTFGYTVLRLGEPVEAMLEIMGRLAPDAVVIHGTHPAARALALTAARPRRLCIYFTTTFYGYPAMAPNTAAHIRHAVCSPFLAKFAKAYLGHSVALLPPLIEAADYRCDSQGDAVLFVNPSPANGAQRVATVAARLTHRRFLVVRSCTEPLRPLPIGLLRPNVEAVGRITDMRRVYSQARLILKPTIMEEGWGRSVSEAQVSGIPAVASDRGALAETVGPGGIVLPLGETVERWCEEIESLFIDAVRHAALSAAAKRHAARPELAPDRVIARFLEFVAP